MSEAKKAAPRKKRPAYKATTRVLKLFDAMSEGTGEVDTLLEEMQEWQSNMEGNSMEALPKYDEVCECVTNLEGVQSTLQDAEEPKDDKLAALEVTVTEMVPSDKRRQTSRATRAGNAASCLEAVKEKVEEYAEGLKDQDQADFKGTLEELAGKLGEAADELQGIDFPGMFG